MPDPKPGLWGVVRRLPTDYSDFGGDVVRWADGDNYPDCSSGCRWARWLKGALGSDWCVCANPASPRAGLLTFEHQAGRGCFEAKGKRPRKEAGEGAPCCNPSPTREEKDATQR